MKIDEFTMKNLPCESCGAIGYKNVLDNQIHDYQLNGKAATWHYSLRQCTNCGMGFISPKPSFEILQTFYSSNYGSYTAATNLEKEATSLKYKLAKFRYASTFGSSINNRAATALGMMSEWLTGKVVSYTLGIPLNLPNDANILELGYGSGSWLLIMKQLGFTNLQGYDIDANIENKKKLETAKIKLHSGCFLDLAPPDNCFDLIRLEHVLEHLLEPDNILKELHRILKPGGYLVMSFPSINAISFSLCPKHSALRESPRHLYLHTTMSARNIIARAGFKIINIRIYAVVRQLESVINNIFKENRIPLTIRGLLLTSPFYNLVNTILKKGEFITVLATK